MAVLPFSTAKSAGIIDMVRKLLHIFHMVFHVFCEWEDICLSGFFKQVLLYAAGMIQKSAIRLICGRVFVCYNRHAAVHIMNNAVLIAQQDWRVRCN